MSDVSVVSTVAVSTVAVSTVAVSTVAVSTVAVSTGDQTQPTGHAGRFISRRSLRLMCVVLFDVPNVVGHLGSLLIFTEFQVALHRLATRSAVAHQQHVVKRIQIDGVVICHRARRSAATAEAMLQNGRQMHQVITHKNFQVLRQ